MPRYAAFLRAINTGGRRVTNAELRAHVEALGFSGVATFRASGNIVFTDERAAPTPDGLRETGERLELRTRATIELIAAAHFAAETGPA